MEFVEDKILLYIHKLEDEGRIDPTCKYCQDRFYPELEKGKLLYEIFAPRHLASPLCQSGKYHHCTCDTCF